MQFPIEIVGNRTLIFRLSLNDFKTRFAGSYLGIVWAFVQPVVTILLYWFVFEMAFHATGVGNVPFALWLTCGLVPWFFFSEALMGGTSSLIEYQYLVKKVVFQIDILPVVKIVSSLYVHVFFVLLTIALFLVSGMGISLYWLQTIYYSFCAVVITLGLAYITSSVTAFFRDLTQIINVLLTVGTWLTPIMWNFDTANLPGVVSIVLTANPMFYIVQGYRDSLVNHIWFWQRPALTLYFWMTAVIVFCLGTVIYRRLKVHFADVL
ncbi:MAG: ABC transporter permease [Lachnospiraceae bacterium]|nr:ABC transporter permease [Lachnospiraceae bacterium]